LSKTHGKKEVIEKIKKWLSEESFQFKEIQSAYAEFQIDLQNPNLSIILNSNKTDSLDFATYSSFSEEDKKAFAALKNKDKKIEILLDLQRSLIEINVGYQLIPDMENLETVMMNKKIYFDGLTKDRFIDTIGTIQRGIFLMSLVHYQLGGKYYSNSDTKFML
jgi:hypothetical protein